MTERLYYDDPYKREFDATVVSVEAHGALKPAPLASPSVSIARRFIPPQAVNRLIPVR